MTALVIGGSAAKEAAASLGKQGADRVLVAAADWLEAFNGDAYAKVAVAAIKAESPEVVFFAATLDGRDVAPRVAAALDVGYAADVTEVKVDGGKLAMVRPLYAAKAYATVKLNTSPQLCSPRPNSFGLAESEGGDAPVSDLALDFDAGAIKSKVTGEDVATTDKVDVGEADIVVAGGRGLKGPEHFKLLDDLADLLGGAVGASRAVVDAGWRPHGDQIGQTGKTVAPNLYFAIGISGAIQHLAGMSTSKCIVAINKDKDAPIFKVADYGIVGDLFEVVPKLTEELTKLKG